MSSRPWHELDRSQRRREVIVTVIATAITWVLLVGIYYLAPLTDRTSAGWLVRLVLGVVAFAAVLAWQLRMVVDADVPGLRAVRALGAIIPVFLLVYAAVYVSLSQASTTHFSEALDHSSALYLTITIFSTVGFGDITPEGNVARLVVSTQMLLDLVVIGTVVRLLARAATVSRGGTDAP